MKPTAEEIFTTIKDNRYNSPEEAIEMIREYGRRQSEQLRNMIIETHLANQDPEVINKIKSVKLPANY